jgi:glycosyltransferase involved in cell wall biosynthesis/SAM-dependent methyltransferase
MRIGVDFRFLSIGRSAVNRGVGRYTQQQVVEVIRIAREHDFVLAVRSDAELDCLRTEIRSAANVEIAEIPKRLCPPALTQPASTTLQRWSEFQGWLLDQDLDVFHVTVPFLPTEPTLGANDGCASVATHYDLIPVVYREHYLDGYENTPMRRFFVQTMRALRYVDQALAISRHTANELAHYVGTPMERIRVAYPVADPCFRPLEEKAARQLVEHLDRELDGRLGGRFWLCVSHLHYSKNLPTLLRAFGMLPAQERRQCPLVLACDLNSSERQAIGLWAAEHRVESDVLMTGFVSDEELAALYGLATAVVHPSRYEGFGLPVLEALSCGAAVAAARATSLTEIVGEAGLLFDPENPEELARVLHELETDEALRTALRARSSKQAALFSPHQLGERTLEAYEAAYASRSAPGRGNGARKPRLAMWTPLPPQHSGIADYAGELAPYLARWADVELFVDQGYEPTASITDAFPVFHHSAFARRHAARPFDLTIYQMGASHYHVFSAEAIARWPGVVVLHDLSWSHVLYHLQGFPGLNVTFEEALGRMAGVDVVQELRAIVARGGDAEEDAIEQLLLANPLLDDIVSASKGVIVHYPEARAELETRYPNVLARWFPMGVKDPYALLPWATRSLARDHLGFAPSTFVVGVFGIAHPVKRIEATVCAIAEASRTLRESNGGAAGRQLVLFVAGEFLDESYKARVLQLARGLGVADQVRVLGRVDEDTWNALLVGCDLVVNLRFPFRKQMSATLMRAIAAGQPLAVTDLADWRFVPETFCRFIPVGEREIGVLAEVILSLARNPAQREVMSRAAREYYLEHCTLERMAEGYRQVVNEVLSQSRTRVAASPPIQAEGIRPRHSSVCNYEHFADCEMADLIRELHPNEAAVGGDVFPIGSEHPGHWEEAMVLRAFRHLGVLHTGATVLALGGSSGNLVFHLTQHAGLVIAAERFFPSSERALRVNPAILIDPSRFTRVQHQPHKLSFKHLDPRVLDLPDNSIDAVCVLGALDTLEEPSAVAAAAFEVGRVLRPGGVACFATRLQIAGPTTTAEAGVALDLHALQRHIVEASGLELVDELDTRLSPATLAGPRPLARALADVAPNGARSYALLETVAGRVLAHAHVALRKGSRFPATVTAWARPSAELREAVRAEIGAVASRLRDDRAADNALPSLIAELTVNGIVDEEGDEMDRAFARWDAVRARAALRHKDQRWIGVRLITFLKRTALRVASLGTIHDRERELFKALIDENRELRRQIRSFEAPDRGRRTTKRQDGA